MAWSVFEPPVRLQYVTVHEWENGPFTAFYTFLKLFTLPQGYGNSICYNNLCSVAKIWHNVCSTNENEFRENVFDCNNSHWREISIHYTALLMLHVTRHSHTHQPTKKCRSKFCCFILPFMPSKLRSAFLKLGWKHVFAGFIFKRCSDLLHN